MLPSKITQALSLTMVLLVILGLISAVQAAPSDKSAGDRKPSADNVEVTLIRNFTGGIPTYFITINSSGVSLGVNGSLAFLAVFIPNTSYGNIVLLRRVFRLGSCFEVPLRAVWLSFGRVLVSVWSPEANLSLTKLFTIDYPPLRVDYIYVNLVDTDGDGLYDSVESDLGVDVNGSAFERFKNVSILMFGTGVFEVVSYRFNESLRPGFNLLRVEAPIPVIKAGESLRVFVNLTFGNGSLTVADCTFGNRSLYDAESKVPLAVVFFSVGNLTKAVAEPGTSVYLGYLPPGNYVGKLKVRNLGLSIPYLNLTETVIVNESSRVVLRKSLSTIHTGASAEVDLTFPVVSNGFVVVNVTYGRLLVTSFYIVYRILNLSCVEVNMNDIKVVGDSVSLMLSLSNTCSMTLRGYVNVSVDSKYVVRHFTLNPHDERRTYVVISSVPMNDHELRVNASVALATPVGMIHAVSKSIVLKHDTTKQSTSPASILRRVAGFTPVMFFAVVIAATAIVYLLYRLKMRH